jgi:hypothetical protein
MTLKTLNASLVVFIAVLVGLVGYNIMSANTGVWAPPSATPPAGNVAAPINIGPITQDKTGLLGATAFVGWQEVRSPKFCNQDTGVCATIEEMLADSSNAGGCTVGDPTCLAFAQHTEGQCTSLGGEVLLDGTSKFCRFNKSSCPAGWAQFKKWSTSPAAKFSGKDGCSGCSVQAKAWSNSNSPSCFVSVRSGSSESCGTDYSKAFSAAKTQIGCY